MGYVGVCAGFYLALQGEPEFHKLAMVSGRHIGEAWIRGVTTIEAREAAGTLHRLFYANGPVIERVTVDGLDPYLELATFVSDVSSPRHGTEPGVMPGSPAVIAATYGRGRLLLFSPNPVLAGSGEAPRTDLFVRAVRWAGEPGPLDPALTLSF
jgi:hypothetical protein